MLEHLVGMMSTFDRTRILPIGYHQMTRIPSDDSITQTKKKDFETKPPSSSITINGKIKKAKYARGDKALEDAK